MILNLSALCLLNVSLCSPAGRSLCLLYGAGQVVSTAFFLKTAAAGNEVDEGVVGAAETDDNSVWVCHSGRHLSHI